MLTVAVTIYIYIIILFRLSYVNTLAGHEGVLSVIATSSTLGDIATVCLIKPHKQTATS